MITMSHSVNNVHAWVLFVSLFVQIQILRTFSVNAQYMCNIYARFSPQCAIYGQNLRKVVLLSPMRNICKRLYFFPQCAIYAQDCTSLPSVPCPLTIYALNIIIQQVIKVSIFLFELTGQTTYNEEKKRSNQM